jgi:hypothetical protein
MKNPPGPKDKAKQKKRGGPKDEDDVDDEEDDLSDEDCEDDANVQKNIVLDNF